MLSPAEPARPYPGGDGPADRLPVSSVPVPPAQIRARVEARLDDARAAWLRRALADAAADAAVSAPPAGAPEGVDAQGAAWESHFASAGRHCGRLAACDVRVLLLHAARAGTATLTRLYRQGTAAERTAVLSALPHLPDAAPAECVPLVEDALRANDTGLVAAAVGPYAAAHLDPHGWRHAVLKCLFTGVPLQAVAALAQRARGDGELARMLRDFAHERSAAGRRVPGDLHHVLDIAEAPADALEGPTGPPAHAPAEAAPQPPEEI
jgi:hypothetical protein